MVHWHPPHENKTVIEVTLQAGKLEKYIATGNLRAFYMELHDLFYDNEFKDIMGAPSEIEKGHFFEHQVKRGEFVDNEKGGPQTTGNRTGDIYEKKFVWAKNADGTIEFELTWQIKRHVPHSPYGWIEVTIDLVNRRITDKEILDGNNKKVLQSGAWEFRNKFVYKNNIVENYLNNIPYVKNSQNLKNLYLNYIHKKLIDEDLHFCEHKIMPLVNNLIHKHFANQ